jgi:hypothetical protein
MGDRLLTQGARGMLAIVGGPGESHGSWGRGSTCQDGGRTRERGPTQMAKKSRKKKARKNSKANHGKRPNS